MTNSRFSRFMGGPPLAVAIRLVLVSILVGVVLELMGLDPLNIIDSVRRLIYRVWYMGFDALHWLFRYLVFGAVLVIPIWLLLRLIRTPQGR